MLEVALCLLALFSDRCCTSGRLIVSPSPKNDAGLLGQGHFCRHNYWVYVAKGGSLQNSRLFFADPTAFPMRLVSYASCICLGRSSLNRFLVDAIFVHDEQRGLRAGLSFHAEIVTINAQRAPKVL